MPRWLLPERISDILPTEARRIEELRRALLDLYRSYGYELVIPPMLEHAAALLNGDDSELALKTFQLVDQLSGRTLGLRADFSPQVARIDAHLLGRQGATRLCYSGSVLHTRPAGLTATREPVHAGVELYGHEGIEADVEVIELMVRSINLAGPRVVRVDLCHMGVVPALLAGTSGVDDDLYALLQSKDAPSLEQYLGRAPLAHGKALLELIRLYGTARGKDSVLARARERLPALDGVRNALDQLDRLVGSPVWDRLPGVELLVDLADLRSDRYHNGISFAAYVDGLGSAVARGGRYDGIGRAFGRARPATGFSLELRELASLSRSAAPLSAVAAPWSDEEALLTKIAQLRAAGRVVIQTLPGQVSEVQEFCCDEELYLDGGQWRLRASKA